MNDPYLRTCNKLCRDFHERCLNCGVLGMTIQIRCNDEDGIFQGIVSDTHFMQYGDAFSIILKNCHKGV